MKSYRYSLKFGLTGLILLLFLAFCIVYSCSRKQENNVDTAPDYDMPAAHQFVGDRSCQSCHQEEWESWKDSHHYYAMAKAGEESVRGDFNDVTFSKGEDYYRFYREDGRYMVDAPGPDGETETYEVMYTFGWEPLQQYLVDFGKGKLQALHVSWDTERDRWFTLYPDEEIQPDDWLHWTGGAMNWNTMCADCHSTNLRQNYIAESDSFDAQWTSINVNCETCHGPGKEHVQFMESKDSDNADIERIREDVSLSRYSTQAEEINNCAPCHSLRQGLTGDYIHGDDYLDHYDPQLPRPDLYFPDGQILEEVYVYGSFLQSKMHQYRVKCSDCHDPHSVRLKANITDNSLCMECHEPSYNTVKHHFHEANTEASQCISCHMPGRYYMENDFRRDHSFRVPRPYLSAEYGTPNACNDCHSDRSPEWASEAIVDWYGEIRDFHYSEVFVKVHAGEEEAINDLKRLIEDRRQPELVRATAIWFLGQMPEHFSDNSNVELLRNSLTSKSALIRKSAANAMAYLPSDLRKDLLVSLLEDSVRAVRLAAIRNLVEFSAEDFENDRQSYFRRALEEYMVYLDFSQYFPQGQMNRAQYYEQVGEVDKAIEAYHEALEKDPMFNPARMNLAYLYSGRGQLKEAQQLLQTVIEQEPEFGEAYYSMALLLAEQDSLHESLHYFEQAAQYTPNRSRIFYNWAIVLQTLDQPGEAEKTYLRAIELDNENMDYRYGLVTLYIQQESFEKALEQTEEMDRMQPNHQEIRQLRQYIQQQMR